MAPANHTHPHDQPIVDGVVLAAGRSRRMGAPKAELPVGSESFVEHAIRVLRAGGCRYVLAVVNDEADWTARLADVAGAGVVLNEEAASEQIDSLRLALAKVPKDTAAVAVLPVDFPLVKDSTVAAVIDAFRRQRSAVVRASYKGAPGHPTIFAREVWGDLMAGELAEGARSVIRAHEAETMDVPVDDPGVVTDIDTPEDFRRNVEQA